MTTVPPIAKSVVAACGPGHRAQHLFAPCLHQHSNGQLLIVCRWDEHGTEEGDATNEQVLYFSRDDGATWTMAGGAPILAYAGGSSFSEPSSITHAWLFEDDQGATWLFYTVNQPFTWGEGRPDRSTGGGEIRKQEIAWNGGDWVRHGASRVVWGFQQPLPDGAGGVARDIRVVSWNGVARLRDDSLVMPIGGRSSVARPRGAFSRLDRVWVLVSRDDGRTWPEAYFVGGSDSLCLAEPVLVETAAPGELHCLLRVQYGTGNQLHRAVSRDGGRSWSPPLPTGLPQADQQGVKPHFIRLRSGRYALLQTNEHQVIERTNLALFLTDEAGLATDDWPQLRTLHIGNRRGWWPGSCYGWLAEARDGALLAAYPCHDATGGRIFFARIDPAHFAPGAPLEANGVNDDWGDHVPRPDGPATPLGNASFAFRNVRGRLVAPDFGLDRRAGRDRVSFAVRLASLPMEGAFPLLRLTARNGRDEVLALLVDRAGWRVREGGAARPLALTAPDSASWLPLDFAIASDRIVGRLGGATFSVAAAETVTGLQFGGAVRPEPCEIFLGDFATA